ncbi:DNA-directed RNA polymerase specialized sigma24 family protein [Shinella sp. BE166]|uniref:sigma-70 family RNA polymerase sigma factor n=1 Tax=Shinella sp. BE166 TaxID=3373918 RepID=UPI003EBDA699
MLHRDNGAWTGSEVYFGVVLHQTALKRFARRFYGNGPDQDDLVQDTIIRALHSAHLYQEGTSLLAWMFTIMRKRCFQATAFSSCFAA